jgi:hypothetical protein
VPKGIYALLIETWGEYAPSYGTVKNSVQFIKHSDFSICDTLRPGQPKTVTTLQIIDQIHELIVDDSRLDFG